MHTYLLEAEFGDSFVKIFYFNEVSKRKQCRKESSAKFLPGSMVLVAEQAHTFMTSILASQRMLYWQAFRRNFCISTRTWLHLLHPLKLWKVVLSRMLQLRVQYGFIWVSRECRWNCREKEACNFVVSAAKKWHIRTALWIWKCGGQSSHHIAIK